MQYCPQPFTVEGLVPVSHHSSVTVLTATLLLALTPASDFSCSFMYHGNLSAGSASSAQLYASDSPSPRQRERKTKRYSRVPIIQHSTLSSSADDVSCMCLHCAILPTVLCHTPPHQNGNRLALTYHLHMDRLLWRFHMKENTALISG